MRRNIMLTFLSVALCALISTAAFAEDVYVTKYGKKFHKEGSRFIKNKETEKLTREEAEERGYEPSSEILKEDADKSSEDTSKESSEAKQ